LATLAKDRFAATELIMLGTLRKDGWPRISPCEYAIWEGDFMVGGIWQSKKCLDLIRDPRCTIHNATSDKNGRGGDVKVYARARRLEPDREARYWDFIWETMHFRPEKAHVFALDVESAGYTVFEGDGTMRWLTWPGNQWRSKRTL
jgi:hypothetical protein